MATAKDIKDGIHRKAPPTTDRGNVTQNHTADGPAEEFINEYDAEAENLPSEKTKTRSTSPGENSKGQDKTTLHN